MNRELRLPLRVRRLGVVALLLAAGAALAVGCAESSLDVGTRPETDASAPPSFAPVADGGDAASPDVPRLLCLGTECPYPYATCASGDSAEPVYECQHDLSTDNDHCGSCGTTCPVYDVLQMKSSCVNGECVAECIDPSFKDCNGRLEDGCEVSVLDDPQNCGACGVACPAGVRCRFGACGCPTGTTECGTSCVDLQGSSAHCGACGNRCTPPDGATPPPNSEYGCVGGECDKLRCVSDHHSRWLDCNGDLEAPGSDGCEVDVGPMAQDTNNCGGCGIACDPDQICREVFGIVQCICKPNETLCGTPDYPICADITGDPEHCGACGYRCPAQEEAHQRATCAKGMCTYECAPGWADCNDTPLDGCETNLMIHGANCGACGNRCNTAAGQPCVGGACLEVECDAGGPQ